jgi:hypothetical protein
LQQYDEAKKSTAVAPSPLKPRVAAAPQAKAATAAELKTEDGWDLCGWQVEPSVVRHDKQQSSAAESLDCADTRMDISNCADATCIHHP